MLQERGTSDKDLKLNDEVIISVEAFQYQGSASD